METNEKIIEICKQLSGMDNVCEESLLQDDLALDSLAMVTLLVEIEDNFEIELDESDMNPFDLNTIKDVIELVKKYLGD